MHGKPVLLSSRAYLQLCPGARRISLTGWTVSAAARSGTNSRHRSIGWRIIRNLVVITNVLSAAAAMQRTIHSIIAYYGALGKGILLLELTTENGFPND
eukprot:2774154-Pleurochrysis_carterae.AAC.2